MKEYIKAIDIALDYSSHRIKWYIETGEQRFLDECADWINVANIYMNTILKNKKYQ